MRQDNTYLGMSYDEVMDYAAEHGLAATLDHLELDTLGNMVTVQQEEEEEAVGPVVHLILFAMLSLPALAVGAMWAGLAYHVVLWGWGITT